MLMAGGDEALAAEVPLPCSVEGTDSVEVADVEEEDTAVAAAAPPDVPEPKEPLKERQAEQAEQKEQKEDVEAMPPFVHSGQGAIRLSFWGKGFLIGIVLICPLLAIGLSWKESRIRVRSERDFWDMDVFLQVFLPALVFHIFAVYMTGRIAYSRGRDILEESSCEIKPSIRNNMTTTGVVLALILSIVAGMLLAELPIEEQNVRVCMWYRVFLLFAIEVCTKGVLISSFFLIYMEPLDEESTKVFVLDNINYVGEPVICICLSLLYFAGAIVLWTFIDGGWLGIFGAMVFCFVIVRTVVVTEYLFIWRNDEVSDSERQMRMKLMTDATQ